MEANSAQLDPWFALAYLNSAQMRTLLDGVARSAIKGRLQPDDLRQLSIPIPTDQNIVTDIADLAREACAAQKKLLPLRASGWRFEDGNAVAPATMANVVPKATFENARVKWGFSVLHPDAKLGALTRIGHRLFVGKRPALSLPSSAPEAALVWLCRYLRTFPPMTTLGTLQSSLKPELPANPADAAAALAKLTADELAQQSVLNEIAIKKSEIESSLAPLFEAIKHPAFS